VIEGLGLRLEALWDAKEDPERAEIAFRTLFRLVYGGPGRPKYPEFSWDNLSHFLASFDEVY
jgi:hypothetical protein